MCNPLSQGKGIPSGRILEWEMDVKEGNMPEYDVDAADVDVGTQEKTITVPDVDIDMPNDNER